MPYRFVEGIVSDVTFEASGSSWKEVFESAAQALFSIMYDPSSISAQKNVDISVESGDIKELLYDFLSDIIVAIETNDMFFTRAEVVISGPRLAARLWGEPATSEKLECIAKGISMHNFSVIQEGNEYKATVTVDI
jgi:SHS2 domain-containing protein